MRRYAYACLAITAILASGCSNDIPKGDAATKLQQDQLGWNAPRGVMIGAGEKPFWVQAALTGYREVSDGDHPKTLDPRDAISGCRFTPPKIGEALRSVQVFETRMDGPVYGITRERIAERTTTFVARSQNNKGEKPRTDSDQDRLDVIDVVVTETAQPVYLVLGFHTPTLFNVHLAQGAEISHVALVGPTAGGVANLAPGVPVELLTDAAARRCGVEPRRLPGAHWPMVKKVKDDPSTYAEPVRLNQVAGSKYSSWHRANFGVGSEDGVIGAHSTSHVLVGPLPNSKARPKYRPLKGSTVVMTDVDYALAGRMSDYKALNSKLILEAAATASGGQVASAK